MSGITLLISYTAYIAFQMPCFSHMQTGDESGDKMGIVHSNYKVIINAYGENDMLMLAVTVMDAFAGLLILLSTVILCVDCDAKTEESQNEYVPRIRTSVY